MVSKKPWSRSQRVQTNRAEVLGGTNSLNAFVWKVHGDPESWTIRCGFPPTQAQNNPFLLDWWSLSSRLMEPRSTSCCPGKKFPSRAGSQWGIQRASNLDRLEPVGEVRDIGDWYQREQVYPFRPHTTPNSSLKLVTGGSTAKKDSNPTTAICSSFEQSDR